jgi:hypothetical protein
MSGLSGALETALDGLAPRVFVAVKITLPDATVIRLLDGAGMVTIDGATYLGRDDTYGVLGTIEGVTDGLGDELPALGISLLPPTNVATAAIAAPSVQGSEVIAMFGAVNPATGASIGTPYTFFAGVVDQAVLSVGKNTRSLQIECVSALEVFFEDEEGVRLTDSYHQSVWPGELGFSLITEMNEPVPWGIATASRATDRATANTSTTAGGAGGGGIDSFAFQGVMN